MQTDEAGFAEAQTKCGLCIINPTLSFAAHSAQRSATNNIHLLLILYALQFERMATPQPPLTPEQRLALEQKAQYDRVKYGIAVSGVILCPLIALIPPRKLDPYTFALGAGTYLSADHLAYQYNGKSLLSQFSSRAPSVPTLRSLPTEKARETAALNEERLELERARREGVEGLKGKGQKTLLQRAWMGDEEEGWKERRLEEERKALEEGKGYSDIILEQIWEVWNWDKRKGKGSDVQKDN